MRPSPASWWTSTTSSGSTTSTATPRGTAACARWRTASIGPCRRTTSFAGWRATSSSSWPRDSIPPRRPPRVARGGLRLPSANRSSSTRSGSRSPCESGVSVYPDHGASASELLRRANDCLIEAKKKKGGARCVAYSDELGRGRIDYYKTEDELKKSLDSPVRDEAFILHSSRRSIGMA